MIALQRSMIALQGTRPADARGYAGNGLGRRLRRILSLAGVTVVLGSLPGCQSISAGSPNVAQIRLIDASPDMPGVDVYQGSGILAYNLGLGTITSYIPTSPGTYSINVDTAGTRQQLATANGTFQTGGQYTVILGDSLAALQETILRDQSQAAPAGQVAFRFVDQATRAGAVDLYLIPSGSTINQVRPAMTGVGFGTNTGYVNVPVGTYTLAAVPAGSIPSAGTASSYTGAAVAYASGVARTFVMVDQQLVTTPGLQVVTADDYDPVGAPNTP